jgi:hypothetical protein
VAGEEFGFSEAALTLSGKRLALKIRSTPTLATGARQRSVTARILLELCLKSAS